MFRPGFQLPGVSPIAFVRSATRRGGGTSGSYNVIGTGGGQAGEYCIIAFTARQGTPLVPDGWTQLVEPVNAALLNGTKILHLLGKRLTGSEGSQAFVSGHSTSGSFNETNVIALYFSGGGDFRVLGTPAFEVTGGNPTPQVIGLAGQSAPALAIGVYAANSSNSSGEGFDSGDMSMSPSSDGGVVVDESSVEEAPWASFGMRYKIYNSSPADVTVDMADLGNGNALLGLGLLP
jgi:hypothetical protein